MVGDVAFRVGVKFLVLELINSKVSKPSRQRKMQVFDEDYYLNGLVEGDDAIDGVQVLEFVVSEGEDDDDMSDFLDFEVDEEPELFTFEDLPLNWAMTLDDMFPACTSEAEARVKWMEPLNLDFWVEEMILDSLAYSLEHFNDGRMSSAVEFKCGLVNAYEASHIIYSIFRILTE